MSLSVFITVMWLEFCALFIVVAIAVVLVVLLLLLVVLVVVVGAAVVTAAAVVVDVEASVVPLPLLLVFAPLPF